MENSHNSSFEKMNKVDLDEVQRLFSSDNQQMLKRCIQITKKSVFITSDDVCELLDVFSEFVDSMNQIHRKQTSMDWAGSLDNSELLNAMKFAFGRQSTKTYSTMGGRNSRIEKIKNDLKYYWDKYHFSPTFFEYCEDLEQQYPKSTIYKALKQIII